MIYHHYRRIDDDSERDRDSGKSVDMDADSGKGIYSQRYKKIDSQGHSNDEHISP